jgi:hypothetical protein
MKIFVCCSKAFYGQVADIKTQLEAAGHVITLPNSYDNPGREDEMKWVGVQEHAKWKASMLRLQKQKVEANDAILVLNFEKAGQADYIGGATFLEMYMAFELGKTIFLYNGIPAGVMRDEISCFEPIVIHHNLSLVSEESLKPANEHLNVIELEEASRVLAGLEPMEEKWYGGPLTPKQLEHAKNCPDCLKSISSFDCLLPPTVLVDQESIAHVQSNE